MLSYHYHQVILHGIHGLDPVLCHLVCLACILGVINVYLRLELHTKHTLSTAEIHLTTLHSIIQQPLIPTAMLDLRTINEGMRSRGPD